MTTNERPMSGRGQSRYPDKLDKYQKDSKSSAIGKNMRTFARSKTSKLVTTWDDVNYFTQLGNYFYPLADVSGAVDTATVGSPAMLAILDLAWELFYTNANLKDLDATDEASWKLYFCAAFCICMDMQLQYNTRCYLPAYTESDTTPGGLTDISFFSQNSYDIFIASMAQYPIPKGIYEIIDIFATWVIQIGEEYSKYTVNIPGAYVFPFMSRYDLADFEAMRELMRTNLGNAVNHSKKFGLKMGKWRDPSKPQVRKLNDVNVIAFFNHMNVNYLDDGTDGVQTLAPIGGFTGANLVADYTATEYFFKDNPNESIIHVLAPWFGTYDATNNPYGGIILEIVPNAEYGLGMLSVGQHGTNIGSAGLGDPICRYMILLIKAGIDNYVKDGDFGIVVTGANLTADKALDEAWTLDIMNNLFYGTNRGATETNNDLINFIGRLLV